MELFVNGTLMRGEALHQNLSACQFLRTAQTVPHYRLFLLGDGTYPGMIRASHGGGSIAGELYAVPGAQVEAIFAREPPHLYLGDVELEGSIWVPGVLCEEAVAPQYPEITAYGGWQGWRKHGTAMA